MMYVDKLRTEGTKYVGDLKKCKRCSNNVYEYYYEKPHVDNSDILCADCKYELNPPKLHLTYMIEHGIWNVTQSRWERQMVLEDFQECGWFVRKITKSAASVRRVPKDTGHKNVHLEFFGNIKCLRVRSKFYPVSLGICGEDMCVIQSIGG